MYSNLEHSKTLAGVGAILVLLSLVPYTGWILGIIGVVLLLKGMKELSNFYQDQEIYKNSLRGVKYYILAFAAAAVAIAAILINVGFATGFAFKSGFVPTVGFGVGLAASFTGLIVAFVFYILAATHLRSFNILAAKSGEASFTTAGELLWWGAVLSIILVGFVLIFIAWIFVTIGFFSMKPQPYNPLQTPPATFSPQGNIIQSKTNNGSATVQ